MQREPLIVLKFGGSVLEDEERLRLAVHEIYRWRRRGWAVVAVVSALAGATDALLAKATVLGEGASPDAVANLLSTGETYSAALLGAHLDRAGVPVCVLSPASLSLLAEGDPLDATPVSLDDGPLRRALARGESVVVPGFVARDLEDRTVVLGRGGSDLTALFLASRLGARRCRLVKDVDGLYERDPALSGPRPARFRRASWDDALRLDGTICQHKALRLARDAGLEFELGRWGDDDPTVVGAGPSELAEPRDEQEPLRVALLGHGTVGRAVRDTLLRSPDRFEIVAVCVRDLERHRRAMADGEEWSTDPSRVAASGAQVVVETMGGTDAARPAILCAFENGAHVVTANKAVLASFGAELRDAARLASRSLLASAAVGGSAPVLERLRGSKVDVTLRGVLNATTNFVLQRLADGSSLDEALSEARSCGLAEQDATRDLDGRDAADKLEVAAQSLGCGEGEFVLLEREALTPDRSQSFDDLERVRQVAELRFEDGRYAGSVRLRELSPGDVLLRAQRDWNIAELKSDEGTSIVRGKGGGAWPTAEAVVADLLDLRRARSSAGEESPSSRPDSRSSRCVS